MKKKILSLVAAASTAFAAFSESNALAQTAAPAPTNKVEAALSPAELEAAKKADEAFRDGLSHEAIETVIKEVGVSYPYFNVGLGFTSAKVKTGTVSEEFVGLQFEIKGTNATPIQAYNLNNYNSERNYIDAKAAASAADARRAAPLPPSTVIVTPPPAPVYVQQPVVVHQPPVVVAPPPVYVPAPVVIHRPPVVVAPPAVSVRIGDVGFRIGPSFNHCAPVYRHPIIIDRHHHHGGWHHRGSWHHGHR